MSSTKKQAITVALDPPDLERVKRVAERERGTPSGVIRRLVVEGLRDESDHGAAVQEQSRRGRIKAALGTYASPGEVAA